MCGPWPGKTGFAYCEDIRLEGLQQAAQAAQSIASVGDPRRLQGFRTNDYPALYPADDPISSLSDADKVQLLQRIDQVARAIDPRVKEVKCSDFSKS